jgi:hypothetical protein
MDDSDNVVRQEPRGVAIIDQDAIGSADFRHPSLLSTQGFRLGRRCRCVAFLRGTSSHVEVEGAVGRLVVGTRNQFYLLFVARGLRFGKIKPNRSL